MSPPIARGIAPLKGRILGTQEHPARLRPAKSVVVPEAAFTLHVPNRGWPQGRLGLLHRRRNSRQPNSAHRRRHWVGFALGQLREDLQRRQTNVVRQAAAMLGVLRAKHVALKGVLGIAGRKFVHCSKVLSTRPLLKYILLVYVSALQTPHAVDQTYRAAVAIAGR